MTDEKLEELIQAVADTLAWRDVCRVKYTEAEDALADATDEVRTARDALGNYLEREIRTRAENSTSHAS